MDNIRSFIEEIWHPGQNDWLSFGPNVLEYFNLPQKTHILFHEQANAIVQLIRRSEPLDAERFPIGNFVCGLAALDWLCKQATASTVSLAWVATVESYRSGPLLSFTDPLDVAKRIEQINPRVFASRDSGEEFVWLDRDLYPRQFGAGSPFRMRKDPPKGLLPL